MSMGMERENAYNAVVAEVEGRGCEANGFDKKVGRTDRAGIRPIKVMNPDRHSWMIGATGPSMEN